jgi:hypothetical protein
MLGGATAWPIVAGAQTRKAAKKFDMSGQISAILAASQEILRPAPGNRSRVFMSDVRTAFHEPSRRVAAARAFVPFRDDRGVPGVCNQELTKFLFCSRNANSDNPSK